MTNVIEREVCLIEEGGRLGLLVFFFEDEKGERDNMGLLS